MLPIYVMWDSGLSSFEQECVKDAMIEFEETFPGRKIVICGSRQWSNGDYSSADWYVRKAKGDGIKLDVDFLLNLMEKEPRQESTPRVDVLITSYDLSTGKESFCYGKTRGRFIVQSVARYERLSFADRKLVIKNMIWRELGHVFGAAMNTSRSDVVRIVDWYCMNVGCAMRWGANLDVWVQHARETERMHRLYCPKCRKDILLSKI